MLARSCTARAPNGAALATATRRPTAFTISAVHRPARRASLVPRAQDPAAAAAAAPSVAESSTDIPPGCSRYSVSLTKPLGIVLEENKATGAITVAEIVAGGSAEKNGEVAVGDVLIATSGYVRTTEQSYGEVTVRGGEQMVRLTVRGESFDTVLAAIGSVPGNMAVTLEFQRC